VPAIHAPDKKLVAGSIAKMAAHTSVIAIGFNNDQDTSRIDPR
jgi:hypothetical protein